MDNPDLNIELRLASSISLAFIAQHQLPHAGLITSLFSCLLVILVKYLKSSKMFFNISYWYKRKRLAFIAKINGKVLTFDFEKSDLNLHPFINGYYGIIKHKISYIFYKVFFNRDLCLR